MFLAKRFRGRRRGFLLLDALLGMMIGLFALVMILPLVIATIASSDVGQENATAYGATRQIIENIRMYKGDSFVTGSYNATAFGDVPQLNDLKNPTSSVTVSTYSGAIRRVFIRITWRAGAQGGTTRNFEAVALISPRGVTP